MADIETAVNRPDGFEVEDHPWGRLVWMVSGRLGNSTTMTVGRCHLPPGQHNPRHLHPNCDEVLHLLTGTIRHSLGDDHVTMAAGDTISIPQGTAHNAENIGDAEAVMVISFSSADRRTVAVS